MKKWITIIIIIIIILNVSNNKEIHVLLHIFVTGSMPTWINERKKSFLFIWSMHMSSIVHIYCHQYLVKYSLLEKTNELKFQMNIYWTNQDKDFQSKGSKEDFQLKDERMKEKKKWCPRGCLPLHCAHKLTKERNKQKQQSKSSP